MIGSLRNPDHPSNCAMRGVSPPWIFAEPKCSNGMDAVSADFRSNPSPLKPEPTPGPPAAHGSASGSDRQCLVCGAIFRARRASARSCSGRCRIMLSRTRRVADLVDRVAAAEHALASAEHGLCEARAALGAVRELAEAGGAKVAP